MRKSLLKLTGIDDEGTILVGIESIINVKRVRHEGVLCTRIQSRGAMVATCWVEETPEQIFNQCQTE
jgi:hypothetical protein